MLCRNVPSGKKYLFPTWECHAGIGMIKIKSYVTFSVGPVSGNVSGGGRTRPHNLVDHYTFTGRPRHIRPHMYTGMLWWIIILDAITESGCARWPSAPSQDGERDLGQLIPSSHCSCTKETSNIPICIKWETTEGALKEKWRRPPKKSDNMTSSNVMGYYIQTLELTLILSIQIHQAVNYKCYPLST